MLHLHQKHLRTTFSDSSDYRSFLSLRQDLFDKSIQEQSQIQHGRCEQRCVVLSFLDSFYFYWSAVLNWLLGSQGATGCRVRGWQTTVCCLRRLSVKTMFLSMTLICFRGSVCSLRQTKLEYFLVCVCGCECVWGGRRIVTSSWHTCFHTRNQKFISVCSFWSFCYFSFWSFGSFFCRFDILDVILSSIFQVNKSRI